MKLVLLLQRLSKKLLQRLLQLQRLVLRKLTFQTSVVTKLKLLKLWLRLVTRLLLNNL
ncbi:hypothetical protein W824_09790 [Clavibacter cf. michiganensis LMG 26808]|nr:hypothetical protein W824_09790 [Clavibacter cf. michiganensis LMG 26808]